jgi:hypothetical protein
VNMEGDEAGFLSNVSIALQFAILILLLVGNKFARDKKLMRHGQLMALAVGLHTVSITIVMIPSLINNVDLLGNLYKSGSLTTWAHVVSGTLAEVWGIALVAMWGFQGPSKMTCKKRKRQMWSIFAL